jgi:hypothetical protein
VYFKKINVREVGTAIGSETFRNIDNIAGKL